MQHETEKDEAGSVQFKPQGTSSLSGQVIISSSDKLPSLLSFLKKYDMEFTSFELLLLLLVSDPSEIGNSPDKSNTCLPDLG
jgi:hypothetical protein